MTKSEYLDRYAEGWMTGNIEMITEVLDDTYYLDDPDIGKVFKEDMPEYLGAAKEQVADLRGGEDTGVFYEFEDNISQEADGILTSWCWWSIPGTSLQGSGLTKIGDNGVLSERVAYYISPSQ